MAHIGAAMSMCMQLIRIEARQTTWDADYKNTRDSRLRTLSRRHSRWTAVASMGTSGRIASPQAFVLTVATLIAACALPRSTSGEGQEQTCGMRRLLAHDAQESVLYDGEWVLQGGAHMTVARCVQSCVSG